MSLHFIIVLRLLNESRYIGQAPSPPWGTLPKLCVMESDIGQVSRIYFLNCTPKNTSDAFFISFVH